MENKRGLNFIYLVIASFLICFAFLAILKILDNSFLYSICALIGLIFLILYIWISNKLIKKKMGLKFFAYPIITSVICLIISFILVCLFASPSASYGLGFIFLFTLPIGGLASIIAFFVGLYEEFEEFENKKIIIIIISVLLAMFILFKLF